MEINAVIAHLNKMTKHFEAAHVTTFKCYRETADGGPKGITVEIRDSGPEMEGARYSCVARSNDDGKAASGNPHDRVEVALSSVHWWDLD
jgi:hypothetical protein